MNTIWLSMLIGSSALLVWIVALHKLSWGWVRGFSLHLIMAAACLYLLNNSGLLPDVYIPLNPLTVGTVVVLGIPGVVLMAGLQWIVV